MGCWWRWKIKLNTKACLGCGWVLTLLFVQVEHSGDYFLIVNNADGATERKLSITPISTPGKENWKDVLPYDPAVRVSDIDAFAEFVVMSGRQDGITQLWTMSLESDGKVDSGSKHRIKFEEPLYCVYVRCARASVLSFYVWSCLCVVVPHCVDMAGLCVDTWTSSENEEFDVDTVRLSYSSLVQPRSVVEYTPSVRELELVKQDECPKYDPAQYTSRRIMIRARDGVEVPVSLVYRKDVWASESGSAPTAPLPMMLYGYGSYGAAEKGRL